MVTCVPIAKELHSFFVTYFMYDKGKLESLVNILLLEFYLLWDLFDPTFTEDWYSLTPPHPHLMHKPHQYTLSPLLLPPKSRHDCSNGMTLRILQTQENKSSNMQNMIRLDYVSWNTRCAPEVDRTKLDRVFTHVGKMLNQD